MFFIGQGGGAVGNHDRIKIEHHGVASGRFTADIGLSAGDQNVVNATTAQEPFKPR